eukprot:tig00021434_g21371.t1
MAESPTAAGSPTGASPPSPAQSHQHPEVPPLRPLSSASTPALRRTPSMLGSNRPNSSPAVRLRGPRMSVAEGVGKPAVVAGRGAYLPFGGEVERPRPATASGLPAAGGGAGSRPASRSASALARPRSRGTTAGSLILDEDPNYVPEEDRESFFWSPKKIFHLHFLRRNLHYRELFAVRERLARSSYSQEIEAKFRGGKVGGSSLGRFGQIMKEFYDINCLPGGCASYILSRAQNYVKGVGVCLEKGWELRFNQQWHFQFMKEVHLNNGIPHHFQVRHEEAAKDPLALLFQKDRSTRLTNVVDLVTAFALLDATYHVHSVRLKRSLLIAQTVAALRNLKDGGSLVLLLDVGPRVWPAGVAERLAGYGQRWMHAVHADEVEFLHICSVDGATGGSISLQGGEERFSPERFVEINAGFLLKIYEPVWRSFKAYAESFLQQQQQQQPGRGPYASLSTSASTSALATPLPPSSSSSSFRRERPPAPGTSASASASAPSAPSSSSLRRGVSFPVAAPAPLRQQWLGEG